VLLLGYPFSFSPWGIVSGLFWVPGGVATIFAVKTAGMAVGVGVASSFIVLVSFTWGIFIFQENVKSKIGACFAVILMVVGIIGMAVYSVPESFESEVVPVILPQRENQLLENRFNDDVTDRSNETHIPITESIKTGEYSSLQECVSGPTSPKYFLGILAAVFNGVWGGSIMVPMQWSG
jgi:Transmembrane family, TMEM144 of transporters